MIYKIPLSEIKEIISKTHFYNDGDIYERQYWTFFKERFPNCEMFWRYFIVFLTKRVEANINNPGERIYNRDGISDDIKDASSFHYSMFMNLVYAYDHLQNFRLSSFEDFYTHLGSTCDLAEFFLLKIYLIILECRNEKSKAYEEYLKLDKTSQRKLSSKHYVLDEYFKDLDSWKEYKRFTRKIREYRNVIVHDVQIGRIITFGETTLVPKKGKIQAYKKWNDVFAAKENIEKLKKEFINLKEQMILDIGKLEIILNELWNKPINDLKKLFFEEKNEILLRKYNIDLIEAIKDVDPKKESRDTGTSANTQHPPTDSSAEIQLSSCAAEISQDPPSSMEMPSSFGDKDMKQVFEDLLAEDSADSKKNSKKGD